MTNHPVVRETVHILHDPDLFCMTACSPVPFKGLSKPVFDNLVGEGFGIFPVNHITEIIIGILAEFISMFEEFLDILLLLLVKEIQIQLVIQQMEEGIGQV